MTLLDFIQLLLRNKKWVMLFPLMTACAIFILTRSMPHTYSSDMVIYTGIASGYSVDNDMEGKIDFHEANSKFDNLINTITSKETRKVVALTLLSDLLHSPAELKRVVNNTKLEDLEWLNNPAIVSRVIGKSEAETFQHLSNQVNQGVGNRFYKLLFDKESNPFNVNTLNGVKAGRLGFSDMVKVEYSSEDALIAKKTLDILADVFMSKYKGMRVGEVSNVVKYFQEQTALSLQRLQQAESSLKNFKTTNKVINYYEQTKYIADQKEDYEQRESQLKMDLSGYRSALSKVEHKLNARTLVQLKSEDVIQARNELSSQYNSMGIALVKGEMNDRRTSAKIESLKADLKQNVQGLYEMNNSTEGLPGKEMLDEWLRLTLSAEESNSKLKVLENSMSKFEKVYDHFAPMGSDLTKLERDVEVAEKEYLNLLHNLNQAKLRERNLVVTDNISVTDPPDLPVVANSSKRMILTIAGFFASLFLVMTMLVLKEYLDDSLLNPIRLREITGLKTATAFPSMNQKPGGIQVALRKLSIERWMLSLMDVRDKIGDQSLTLLTVPFHQTVMGDQHLLNDLVNSYTGLGHTLKTCRQDQFSSSLTDIIVLSETASRELIRKDLLKDTCLIYLIMDAEQKFDAYQQQLLENWKLLQIPIEVVLVNTKLNELEKFLGEIPKQRSKMRTLFKNLIKRYTK